MKTLLVLTQKELGHLFNNPLGYLFCSLFPATLAYFLFWQASGTNIFVNGTSDLRLFFKLAPFFLAIFVPLLAMRSWSEEKRQGTMEWLLALPLSNVTLVWAKFLAPLLAVILSLAATLPFAYTLAKLGGIDWGPTLTGYLGLLLFSGVALAFALWVSSTTRHQILAFLFSFLIFSFFAFFENSPLNLNFRLQQMAQGLLNISDLVYFLSLQGFFLFLNIHFLRQARVSGFSGWFGFQKAFRLVLVALLCIMINGLAKFIPLRGDFTREGLYSLSPSTVQVLNSLEDEVHLKLFFSTTLPPQFQPVLAFINQMADQFEARSHGKLRVIRLNPDQNEAIRREALGYGVKETAGNVTQKSRVEVVKIWFGMVLTMGERKVVFPTMQDIPNLEYDLTAALLKVKTSQRKKVMLAGPLPPSPLGHDPEKEMAPLTRELQKQFDIITKGIYPDKTEAFGEADALIVWGAREFTEDQMVELEQFILSGKPVLLFTTGVNVQIMELIARDFPADQADAFFEHLGFKVGRNLVSDNSCQKIQSSGANHLLAEYPLFPLLSPRLNCFPSIFQPLESLNSLTLPWCSTVTPLAGKEAMVLLQTSKQAWLQEKIYELNPEKVPGPTSFNTYPLGLLISGNATRFFSKGDIMETNHRKLMVIGSHHVLGQYQNPSSLAFLTNTMGYWCADVNLGDIERRENAFRPLPAEITFETKRKYQYLNLLFGPIVFAVGGGVYYLRRRWRNYSDFANKRS